MSPSPTSLPLEVADEAGYFLEHGLTLNRSYVASTVAVQGLVSGSLDVYHGGAASITATLGGGDLAYVAATVDRSSLTLIGEKGLASFPDFRGKTIATTAAGAFGEIAVLHTARQYGMVTGQDFAIRYHANSEAIFAAFSAGLSKARPSRRPGTCACWTLGIPCLSTITSKGSRSSGRARRDARLHSGQPEHDQGVSARVFGRHEAWR